MKSYLLKSLSLLLFAGALPSLAWAQNEEIQSAIDSLKTVGPHGENHEVAMAAMKKLNAATADNVPQLLEGMDGANSLALNWLRGAIQVAMTNGGELPRTTIEDYFSDKSRSHMGRLMAFELLTEGNPELADEIIPTLINDPSLPLRQMAVNSFIKQAKEAEGAESIAILGRTLPNARDVGQVQAIIKQLKEHGIEIDVQRQLGFIPSWHIVGPFDNREEVGYDKAYGPEKNLAEVDVTAEYDDGKEGETLSWQEFNSVQSSAVVNLNDILGNHKGAIAYCYAEFDSENEQPIEVRVGSINGHKVWLNGEEIINNQIYHVGMQPDQWSGTGQLKKGINTILLKICQNEQQQEWAQEWMYQVRICEPDGKAVLPKEPVQPGQ